MKKYLLFIFLTVSYSGFSQSPAEGLLHQGIEAYGKSDYTNAIVLLKKAVAVSLKNHDSKILQPAYNNLGNAYSQTGRSEESLRYYFLSVTEAKKIKDTLGISKVLKNIGAMYSEQKDFKTAMSYYNQALGFSRKLNNLPLTADCLNNMGVVYEQQLDYKKALKVYSEALNIYKSENDQERIAMAMNNLAIVCKYLKNYPESIRNYMGSLAISEKSGDKFMVAANQNNLGNVYALTGDYKKSLDLCLSANENAKAIGAQEIVVESYDGIATAYEKMRNYTESIRYRKLYEKEKDSFINSGRSSQLTEMQVKYETRQKTDEIKIGRLEIKAQQRKIEKRNLLIILFIMLLSGLMLAAYLWKSRQKLKNQIERQKAVRETEEQERIRIARDIHDDLGSGLSKINFLSEIILQKTAGLPEVANSATSVKETAAKMVENMRDLIWALNPDNTTLANLLARMREYTTDYLEDYPIEARYSFPENVPQKPITKESHRELFMVVKETLNNISKHAGATTIFFSIIITGESFTMAIKDNGKGFDTVTVKNGNGLRNMKNRLSGINGKFSMQTKADHGTEINVIVPLEQILQP